MRRTKSLFLTLVLGAAVLGPRAASAEPFTLTLTGPAEYTLGAPITGFAGKVRAGVGNTTVAAPTMVEYYVDDVHKGSVRAEADGEYRFTLAAIADNGPHTVQAFVFRGTPLLESASPTLSIHSAAKLTMTPASYDLGTIVAGTGSYARNFTVTNIGAGTSGPLVITHNGTGVTRSGCGSVLLSGGASCVVTLTYTPTSTGTLFSTLTVRSNPGNQVQSTLKAIVTGLSLLPSGVLFPQTAPGGSSSPQIVTVTNTASIASGTLSLTPAGIDPTMFPVSNDTCTGVSLAPGGQCGFKVTFAPTSEGMKTAWIAVSGAPGGSPQFGASGNAVGARLDIDPPGTDYGNIGLGISSDRTMKVRNTGLLTSGPISLAIGGPDASRFSIVVDPCSGATLAAGAQCTFTVRFTPGGSDLRTAHVTASASPGGSFSAWLKGVGTI